MTFPVYLTRDVIASRVFEYNGKGDKKMRRLVTGLLVLAAVLLMVTGCGQSKGETVSRDQQFVVGMECNYAPFNWTTLEEGDTTVAISAVDYADGYDVVMAQKIADAMGKQLVIKKIEWNGLEPAVRNGEIDAIIAGMTATPQREENADFTTPYYESEMVMIVRRDSAYVNATSIQDFSGARVLGQLNTLYDEVIDQIEQVDHATPLATYPMMVVALQSGDVDAITAELPVAQGIVSSNSDLVMIRFEEGMGFVADTTVSIAVRKGNTELLNEIQAALDEIPVEERNQIMLDATNRQPAVE